MKILLVCSAGMSTSLLTNSMRKFSPEDTIDAVPYSEMDEVVADYDVVLLGPQIKFRLKEASAKIAPKPVAVVDMRAYGTMDGPTVIGQAKTLLASAAS